MCDAAATTTTIAVGGGAGTVTVTGGASVGTSTGASDTATAMDEQAQQQRTRQNCCRLCIAPASECISIINSYAADKEPLATKIHNCVNIKVSSNHTHMSYTLIHIGIETSTSIRFLPACVLSECSISSSYRNRYTHTALAPIPGSEQALPALPHPRMMMVMMGHPFNTCVRNR